MAAIERAFEDARAAGRKVLIPYCMGGYPSFDESAELIVAVAAAGADIIEIGIPFSDPLADGPTIQAASQAALDGGFTSKKAMRLVRTVRESTDVPLVFMTYYNIVLHYGLKKFARDASRAGVDGVILPDLPPEEALAWHEAAAAPPAGKLDTIYLLAPTSTDERIAEIGARSEGFVYAVSTTGVTGARTRLPVELSRFVGKIKKSSGRPVAVGFGVSTPDQARKVGKIADGVIIGSALIDAIRRGGRGSGTNAAVRFIRSVRKALDGR